jgi:hypothetical protein
VWASGTNTEDVFNREGAAASADSDTGFGGGAGGDSAGKGVGAGAGDDTDGRRSLTQPGTEVSRRIHVQKADTE